MDKEPELANEKSKQRHMTREQLVTAMSEGRTFQEVSAEASVPLKRAWEYAATDQEITHEMYHDDAVLEFPQSQERFEGKANFLAWRKLYPASLEFEIRRIRGRGDFWVAENSIRYDDGPWNYTCSILEFRGDKVARETIYITQGWEAPEWRAPWRAEWKDESLG